MLFVHIISFNPVMTLISNLTNLTHCMMSLCMSLSDSDSGLPDVLVEYDDETTDDLLLPDQSKPHSDPLSLVLSARCIAGTASWLLGLTMTYTCVNMRYCLVLNDL